jgi:transketolase
VEIVTENIAGINTIPCRQVFTDSLLQLAQTDPGIMVVTSDARGSVTLNKFADTLPNQFVEVGIAEQNAVGIGAGLAAMGKKVFVCGPACFYSTRSLEQVKVDVAYSQYPVKIIGVSGGVSYGALGSSHHSLHDIAAMRTFPGMSIFLPSDNIQTQWLTQTLVNYDAPAYVRMGRGAVPLIYHNQNAEFKIGRANTLKEGDDVCLIGTGEMVYHCLQAARLLEKDGIQALVLDMHTLKPFDTDAVINAAKLTGAILTAEEHSIFGGLGAAVAETLAEHQPVPMKICGIPDENAVHGSSAEIFKHYGLTAESLAVSAKALLKRKTR